MTGLDPSESSLVSSGAPGATVIADAWKPVPPPPISTGRAAAIGATLVVWAPLIGVLALWLHGGSPRRSEILVPSIVVWAIATFLIFPIGAFILNARAIAREEGVLGVVLSMTVALVIGALAGMVVAHRVAPIALDRDVFLVNAKVVALVGLVAHGIAQLLADRENRGSFASAASMAMCVAATAGALTTRVGYG
jgi:hypothetical protein